MTCTLPVTSHCLGTRSEMVQGRPDACASIMVTGSPSYRLGRMKESMPCKTRAAHVGTYAEEPHCVMQTKLIHLGLDLVFQFVVQFAAAYEPQDAVRALLVDFGEDIDQNVWFFCGKNLPTCPSTKVSGSVTPNSARTLWQGMNRSDRRRCQSRCAAESPCSGSSHRTANPQASAACEHMCDVFRQPHAEILAEYGFQVESDRTVVRVSDADRNALLCSYPQREVAAFLKIRMDNLVFRMLLEESTEFTLCTVRNTAGTSGTCGRCVRPTPRSHPHRPHGNRD